jgi:hypothetical protein
MPNVLKRSAIVPRQSHYHYQARTPEKRPSLSPHCLVLIRQISNYWRRAEIGGRSLP